MDNGHTIVVSPFEAEDLFFTLTALDQNEIESEYNAIQFHFHSPSEHTIEGVQADLEMHIVSEFISEHSQDRTLAVFSLLFEDTGSEVTAGLPLLEKIIKEQDKLPEGVTKDYKLNFGELMGPHMPGSADFYHYEGSLTTPTCDETVNWYVFKEIINIPGLRFFKNKW